VNAPRRAALLAGAALALAIPASASAAMSVLYDLDGPVRQIVDPTDGSRGLDGARGAFRQEGSSSHLFGGPADAAYRLGKVGGAALARMSPQGMAATLRANIDGCRIAGRDYGCESHLVAVDEIGARYDDGPVPSHPARRFAGRRAARAAGPPPAVPLPPVDPAGPGAKLARAMQLLDVPSPYGGTYASRVHFYVAPAVISSIGAGRGPNRNLGRDGWPHFATWRGVMPALARGGGVWLEMYHGHTGSATAFTAAEWRRWPSAVVGRLLGAGGNPAQVHFLMARTPSAPRGARGCAGPMACTWQLAGSGPNRTFLLNGPGGYQLGDQAGEWLRQYNAVFA
jgi:hypothetical protein